MAAQKSKKDSPKQPMKTEDSRTHGSSITLKELVFLKLRQYPHIKTKEICRLLELNYKQYRGTIWSYRYDWRKLESIINKAHKPDTHRARAACVAVKSLDRVLALLVGWIQSKGKNKELLWKKNPSYGRIRWFQNGRIIIHIKKPQTMARVKRFLCKAFFDTGLINNPKVLHVFLSEVHWHGATDVFKSGSNKRLPYMQIEKYKESHGIVFRMGDSTHPYDVEVDWVHADWIERQEQQQKLNIKAIDNNSKQIQQFTKFMKDLTAPKKPSPDSSRMVV